MIQKNKTQSFGRLPMCSAGYEIRISMQQQREERRGGYWRGGVAKLADIVALYASHLDMYRQPRLNSPGKYFAFFWPLFRFARYGCVCVMTFTIKRPESH